MSRTKRYVQRKAIERLPGPALDAIGKAVLMAVDRAVEDRWDRALRVAAEAEGETVDQRVRSITKSFRRELSAMGAATGAVAAAPGIGTTAAASALVADLGWFAMRSTDLIMSIGAASGYTTSSVEERRAWVLSVLAFGEDAASQFSTLLREIDTEALAGGERITARLAGFAGSDAVTLDALRRINASLTATVITKYGSRRSLLAVGKLLPFGIGAVVGGTANYAMIRVVGSQARRFFGDYGELLHRTPFPGETTVSQRSARRLRRGSTHSPADADVCESQSADSGSRRLPNPLARLTKADRRNAIPTSEHGHRP